MAPATRSAAALHKVRTHTLDDGSAAHSFQTLLHHLSTIVRNTCIIPSTDADPPVFAIDTTPNAKQRRAYELLKTIAV